MTLHLPLAFLLRIKRLCTPCGTAPSATVKDWFEMMVEGVVIVIPVALPKPGSTSKKYSAAVILVCADAIQQQQQHTIIAKIFRMIIIFVTLGNVQLAEVFMIKYTIPDTGCQLQLLIELY